MTKSEIQDALGALAGWETADNALHRQFVLRDFVAAMGFVMSIALLAERAGHHPDLLIRWNRVDVTLSTHDEGGVTQKDVALAREIGALAGSA